MFNATLFYVPFDGYIKSITFDAIKVWQRY